jgi:hypothetical protein
MSSAPSSTGTTGTILVRVQLIVIKINCNRSVNRSNYPIYNPLFSSRVPPSTWQYLFCYYLNFDTYRRFGETRCSLPRPSRLYVGITQKIAVWIFTPVKNSDHTLYKMFWYRSIKRDVQRGQWIFKKTKQKNSIRTHTLQEKQGNKCSVELKLLFLYFPSYFLHRCAHINSCSFTIRFSFPTTSWISSLLDVWKVICAY